MQENNNIGNRPPMPPATEYTSKATGYAPIHGIKGQKAAAEQDFRRVNGKIVPPRRMIGPARAPKTIDPIPAMPFLPNINEEEIKVDKKGKNISNQVELAPQQFDQSNQFVKRSNEYNTLTRNLKIFSNAFILLLLAVALEFMRISVPFLPSFLQIEFSIVPEFICLVFYGPIISVAVIVLKNVIHMLIFLLINGTLNYVSDLSRFLTDICFIMTTFIMFRFILGLAHTHRLPRNVRIKGVFLSGLIGAGVTSIIMLPVTRYLIFPMFETFFASRGVQLNIFAYYVEKMPSVKSMLQGMLIFNLPWDFCMLLGVTIFATIIYAIATRRESMHKSK